jgi:hypothetical protein
MLHSISWYAFGTFLAIATLIYYAAVASLFCRKELRHFLSRKIKLLILFPPPLILAVAAFAQDGNQGISQATTMIKGYFTTGCELMYAIGAILALVGAVRVYKEWNSGHQQEAFRAASGWFLSCVFLVIVATVIKSFFSL